MNIVNRLFNTGNGNDEAIEREIKHLESLKSLSPYDRDRLERLKSRTPIKHDHSLNNDQTWAKR